MAGRSCATSGTGDFDAVLAPAVFGSPELQRLRLGADPWHVLAGPSHRLAGDGGPVAALQLRAERLVVTGHRDGAAYDRAVAETLAELGVAFEPYRAGSGPAVFAAVAAGDAVALTTSSAAAGQGVVAHGLAPARNVDLALLWRDGTPAPRWIGSSWRPRRAVRRLAGRARACSRAPPDMGDRRQRLLSVAELDATAQPHLLGDRRGEDEMTRRERRARLGDRAALSTDWSAPRGPRPGGDDRPRARR